MTERLYYVDSSISQFTARVLSCEKSPEGCIIRLDRSAFFPGGGGQEPDGGTIGKCPVITVREREGEIEHITAEPLEVGAQVPCAVDYDVRLARMQAHSGEHIVSGLVHARFGLNNVGFHMGEKTVTIDFDGELSEEDLRLIEAEANAAVTANLPVKAWFPDEADLKSTPYRSKKDLDGGVRLVKIADIDTCACCAPHVKLTGEIGIIKILDSMRHRGGMRIEMSCGKNAAEILSAEHDSVAVVSALLSAKRAEIASAVERVLNELEAQKYRSGELTREIVRLRIKALTETRGNVCLIEGLLGESAARELCEAAADKCTGLAAVLFSPGEGGCRYVIASHSVDLRQNASKINEALRGRGGGSSGMMQGSAGIDLESARQILANLSF